MRRPTVTIAVAAYNEEKNIQNFLRSVLDQTEDGFRIKKIIIIDDGSNDKTTLLAKEFRSNKAMAQKIYIRKYKYRRGKSTRLNEIYKKTKTDFLVQSDADVIFENPDVIGYIIKPLLKLKTVGMTGGNPRALPAQTFIEEAVNCSVRVYTKLREKFNILSVDGRLLAFKSEVIKKIKVPSDMIANDAYTYFCTLTFGYKYKYVKNAVVYFRSPQTVKDQIRQNTRFISASLRMKKYFNHVLVEREYNFDKGELNKLKMKEFLDKPVHSLVIFLINIYCRFRSLRIGDSLTALWDVAFTTKRLQRI